MGRPYEKGALTKPTPLNLRSPVAQGLVEGGSPHDRGNEILGAGFGDVGIQGNEVTFRGGTLICQGLSFSPLQLKALLAGVDRKLDRSARGYICYADTANEPGVLFPMVTIRSLHRRGLLDANFTDMRVHDGDSRGVQNIDGAVHEHCLASPKSPKFQVWTSELGKEVLKELDLLPDGARVLH